MCIDEVIEKLKELKEEHGNIPVRVATSDPYWGVVYNKVDEYTLSVHDKTELNPKIIENQKAVVFSAGYI